MTQFSTEDLRKNIPALPDLEAIEIVSAQEGEVAFRFVPPATLANFHGKVHGGLIYTFGEIAAGMTASTLGKNNVALTGSINYIRPCMIEAPITVAGSVIHNGRSTVVTKVRITNEEGKTIAEASFTLYVLD